MAKRGRPKNSYKPEPEKFSSRFVKYYYVHRDELNEGKRGLYQQRKVAGVCVRCGRKSGGKLFCWRHRKAQEPVIVSMVKKVLDS